MKKSYIFLLASQLLLSIILLTTSCFSETVTPTGMKGVVEKSDRRKRNEQFVFANLNSANPFVTYPSGNGSELIKVFEDEELIVLLFVASITGSTETFYLDKEANRFTLIEIGALQARVEGADFKPIVTYGVLK